MSNIDKHLTDILGVDVEKDRSYVLSDSYNLAICNPSLAKEWHPTKNGNSTPETITPMANQKAWWICSNMHEWEATIDSRSRGNGCPYCDGKKVNIDNCLATINPELSKQWHPTKNGDLTPNDVTSVSGKKAWWICKNGHEYITKIASRKNGHGCPYCRSNKLCFDNCLATKNPSLASEWHPTKNGDLTPFDVFPSSGQEIWWLCKKGHEFEQPCAERHMGNGCPYCAGKKICIDNCLATTNPELSKEWHPIKNGDLTPNDVIAGSHKKAWWICKNGHEYIADVRARNKGSGCPYCSNKRVCLDNCLATTHPELSKEWHPTKNGDLTPNDVIAGSERKVWWICKNGHEWEDGIYKRIENGGKCQKCNSFAFCNPELALEWHPTKNGESTPENTSTGSSHKKAWWKCKNGHEWEARIPDRVNGYGRCIECTSVSFLNPKFMAEWDCNKNSKLNIKIFSPRSKQKAWWKCKNGHEWETRIVDRDNGSCCPYCRALKRKNEK